MKNGLHIKNSTIIPEHELTITASRSSGPGGQHVNKTSSRITVRWNVHKTAALTDEQKERVLQKLAAELTSEGDILVSSSASRSQHQNRELALQQLAKKIKEALYVPKKRVKRHLSHAIKESRLQAKKHHAFLKKRRRESFDE